VDEEEKRCLKAETGLGGERSRGVLRNCGFEHVGTRKVEKEAAAVAVELDCWRCERSKG